MALFKKKEYPSGVVTSYHQIGRITKIDYDEKSVEFYLNEYLDAEARLSGKDFVSQNSHLFLDANFPLNKDTEENLLAVLYTKLKEPIMQQVGYKPVEGSETGETEPDIQDINFFTDATDC